VETDGEEVVGDAPACEDKEEGARSRRRDVDRVREEKHVSCVPEDDEKGESLHR
jgi:hypothetical protein